MLTVLRPGDRLRLHFEPEFRKGRQGQGKVALSLGESGDGGLRLTVTGHFIDVKRVGVNCRFNLKNTTITY